MSRLSTIDDQPVSNNDLQYGTIRYKDKDVHCMAIGCSNNASHEVKLALVNRYGDFCPDCTKYFEERELIVSCSTIDLGIGEGKIVKVPTDEKRVLEQKGSVGEN